MEQLTVAGCRTSVVNNVSLTSDNPSHTALSTGTPVSVVMPVRNEERHLAEAVRHVLAQDYR
jgi:cellulose synthase/poly-beta-1,6-N-acetylglucosamine synthase-like glycosyltransferase